MKRLSRIFTSALLAGCAALAFCSTASAKLPADMDEYMAKYEQEATTPEGTAKLWLEAAFLYQDSSTRSLARDILVHLMKGLPKDFERNAAHSTMVDRIKNQPEIQRSFCAGSSPENNYKADPNNCEITVESSREGLDKTWNLWLKSSGSDSARQITLVKVGDHWKVWSCPGLYMGIRPAVKE